MIQLCVRVCAFIKSAECVHHNGHSSRFQSYAHLAWTPFKPWILMWTTISIRLRKWNDKQMQLLFRSISFSFVGILIASSLCIQTKLDVIKHLAHILLYLHTINPIAVRPRSARSPALFLSHSIPFGFVPLMLSFLPILHTHKKKNIHSLSLGVTTP